MLMVVPDCIGHTRMYQGGRGTEIMALERVPLTTFMPRWARWKVSGRQMRESGIISRTKGKKHPSLVFAFRRVTASSCSLLLLGSFHLIEEGREGRKRETLQMKDVNWRWMRESERARERARARERKREDRMRMSRREEINNGPSSLNEWFFPSLSLSLSLFLTLTHFFCEGAASDRWSSLRDKTLPKSLMDKNSPQRVPR